MLNLPSKLKEQAHPIRVGVIGAGLFGTNLITQIERAPGMRTAAIADVDTAKAIRAYRESGVPDEEFSIVEDAAAADRAFEDGDRAVLAAGDDLARADIDVIVEATGLPDVATRHAFTAIMESTHVVMVSVEADTVVGPILAQLAENNGVTYTMAYGDQPALIVELCDWAETAGFDVVAAGKGNRYREENRHGTPDDIFERIGLDESYADRLDLNPRMYNSFYDGTKVAVEACAVANATGFRPDVTGMHLPTAEISEIPEKLRPKADGGILNDTGVVETVSTVYPDGSMVQEDISMGVFVVTRSPVDRVREYLSEQYGGTGVYTASDGEYHVFYRPHHLPGLETAISVANAALRNEPTGVPRAREAEVVGAAKRDLDPGDELDGGGGSTAYGVLADADVASDRGYVPFELLDGAEVVRDVPTDDIVTYDDVALEEDSFIYHLRDIQDQL